MFKSIYILSVLSCMSGCGLLLSATNGISNAVAASKNAEAQRAAAARAVAEAEAQRQERYQAYQAAQARQQEAYAEQRQNIAEARYQAELRRQADLDRVQESENERIKAEKEVELEKVRVDEYRLQQEKEETARQEEDLVATKQKAEIEAKQVEAHKHDPSVIAARERISKEKEDARKAYEDSCGATPALKMPERMPLAAYLWLKNHLTEGASNFKALDCSVPHLTEKQCWMTDCKVYTGNSLAPNMDILFSIQSEEVIAHKVVR
jgi:hypothetical protein